MLYFKGAQLFRWLLPVLGPLAAINRFKTKLKLLKDQNLRRIMVHFPTCSLHISQERLSVVRSKYAEEIEILTEEFNKTFVPFHAKRICN